MAFSLEDLTRLMEKNGKNVRSEFERVVSKNALKGRADAVKKAPAAFGKLRQSIGIEEVSKLEKLVVVNANYGVFVEFGTGAKVDIPAEWKPIIDSLPKQTFRFDEMLTRLQAWCKLKGIDEKFAYPILITNLKEGIEPRPFMRPAFEEVKKSFEKDIKDVIQKSR
jgi:HK97 gp10 family phage protein